MTKKPKPKPKPTVPVCNVCGQPLTSCVCKHNDLRK